MTRSTPADLTHDDTRRARHRRHGGIGREQARELALRGDAVVLTARDLAKAGRAAAALPGRERVMARRLDVTDPASVEQVAADLNRRHGRLDVLVNNAAIHYNTWQRASTADLQVVREALEVNLLGAWQTSPILLPLLRASRHGASSMSPAKLAHGGHRRAGQRDVRVRHRRPRGVRALSEGWAWAVPTLAHPVPARELLGGPGSAAQGAGLQWRLLLMQHRRSVADQFPISRGRAATGRNVAVSDCWATTRASVLAGACLVVARAR
jgi:hypothetical protein